VVDTVEPAAVARPSSVRLAVTAMVTAETVVTAASAPAIAAHFLPLFRRGAGPGAMPHGGTGGSGEPHCGAG
jgi:hypothetical protein